MFDCFIHFGDGSLIDGILRPRIYTLPKLNRAKNIQLGLFDDDIEIGSISRFNRLNLEKSIMENPILKHAKLLQMELYSLGHSISFLNLLVEIEDPKRKGGYWKVRNLI